MSPVFIFRTPKLRDYLSDYLRKVKDIYYFEMVKKLCLGKSFMSLGSDSHWFRRQYFLPNIFWTKIEKFYHNVSEGKIGLRFPQYQVSKLKNLYWLFQLFLGMTQEKLKKLVKPQEVYHRTLLDLPQ